MQILYLILNKIIYCSQKIKFNYPSLSVVHDELKNNPKVKVDKIIVKDSKIDFKVISSTIKITIENQHRK